MHTRHALLGTFATALLSASAVLPAATTAAATDPSDDAADEPVTAYVMDRDDLDADEARDFLDRKRSQTEALQRLEAGGVATQGAYFDEDTLVVFVDGPSDADAVEDSGLEVRSGRGEEDLGSIADEAAEVTSGSRSLRSITPDLKRQRVVVTLAPDAPSSLLTSLRSIEGVAIESGPALSTTADVVPGRIMDLDPGTNCSLGFPGTTRTGNNVLLTAGHCIEGLPRILDGNGTQIGRGVDSKFVTGRSGKDIGLVDIDAEDRGRPFIDSRGAVGNVPIFGLSKNPVGSEVCKAGNTTGWTCGTINAYDVTVNYIGGTTISGLVDSTVCTEGGDSGGAYIGAGNLAQGMTSGGPQFSNCGRFNSGGSNQDRSYYAPVVDAANTYGVTILTQ